MPELWLRKIFPKTVFVTTNLAENHIKVARSQQELDELDDYSTDIFKSNIVHYTNRATNIPVINNMCLALFAAFISRNTKVIMMKYLTPNLKW
jgi:hypothetical protein